MPLNQHSRPENTSRRAFLRRAGALPLASSAAPWALALSSIADAAAQSATDYKALVCVFLQGGNDNWNTVVPYDAPHHAMYRSLRSDIAYTRDALAPGVLQSSVLPADTRQFALAPELARGLLPLFAQQRLAVLHNVGTLMQPTTKAQYEAGSVLLPPKLFSHNDQQSYWQASSAEGAVRGWGGRLGDLAIAGNEKATFTCINVADNAVFLSGDTAAGYQVTTPDGVLPVFGLEGLYGSAAVGRALGSLMTAPSSNLLAHEHAMIAKRSIESFDVIDGALRKTPQPGTFPEGNHLSDQLAMVAHIIAARQDLGAKRQVFFVSMGGFDTHDNQNDSHPRLMGLVGDAMAAFYSATVEMGIADQVTSFTASDFGRTLVSNSRGSDHGWGGSHFVLGGAVNGGRFVGPAPVPAHNGPDDVGQGRLLPALAVEQYAGTLARWFGVSAAQLPSVLPRLGQFTQQDLGFMQL